MPNVHQLLAAVTLVSFTLGYWIVGAILRKTGVRGLKGLGNLNPDSGWSAPACNEDRGHLNVTEVCTANIPQPVMVVPDQQGAPGTADDLAAEIAWLQAENARLKALPPRGLILKTSEKGALSVYGLGRFPTTLYREQWEKLLAYADAIRDFIADHPELKSRD